MLQGVERYRGRLIVHSLGNFAFDQDRLETMLSALAWVDMRGDMTERLRFTPIYLDDFRPRPIGGALADRLIRRMAESSQPDGMLVYPFAGQGWVSLEDEDTIARTPSITVEVTIGPKGANIVDLRRLASSDESLSGVDAPARLDLQLGRDILSLGDFESWDVPAITDQPGPEANRWNFVGGGGQVCRHRRLAGAASACLAPRARMAFKNRARVWGDALDQPNKDLSVIGYAAASAAGPLDLLVTYQASEKEAEFGGQRFRLSAGGFRVAAILGQSRDACGRDK